MSLIHRIARAIALLAWGIWLGGLVALGAISAPLVFRNVPAPYSADAMTLVFRRFDLVAMVCAAIVVARELVALMGTATIRKVDTARIVSALVAATLAVVEGVWLSPVIEELHRAGAVRGVGELGERLAVMHTRAEGVSKVELLCLMAFIVFVVFSDPPAKTAAG
ncbi:DUF4149 domain-containing protein [Pendulispora albinea]|uniref:DUF4149 domain-containing protein n=1 Tax=Pendulispora albinea TaxID=2741071 RepID=A0ABZ2M8M1_9BACT